MAGRHGSSAELCTGLEGKERRVKRYSIAGGHRPNPFRALFISVPDDRGAGWTVGLDVTVDNEGNRTCTFRKNFVFHSNLIDSLVMQNKHPKYAYE